jgi:hypothetical protein
MQMDKEEPGLSGAGLEWTRMRVISMPLKTPTIKHIGSEEMTVHQPARTKDQDEKDVRDHARGRLTRHQTPSV